MPGKYELSATAGGQCMFNLKAANGQEIGRSQMYSSAAARENGIASVKTNGPAAEITDTTLV